MKIKKKKDEKCFRCFLYLRVVYSTFPRSDRFRNNNFSSLCHESNFSRCSGVEDRKSVLLIMTNIYTVI